MLLRTLFKVVAVLSVFSAIASADEPENGYIFTSTRSLKIGTDNELQLIRFGKLDQEIVTVSLYYRDSYGNNETLAIQKQFVLEEGKKHSIFQLFVEPFESDSVYSGRLEINGTIGGKPIGGSDKVYFSTVKSDIIIIQTDKPLYQPGQKVFYRVLKLNKQLKPSESLDDVVNVTITDPRETLLALQNDVPLSKGMMQLDYMLSDEPVLGTWKITASTNTEKQAAFFDVKEYVLPKFDVNIKFPSFVLANAETVPIEVCAKYTYGKPVKGVLNLNVSLESYTWSRDKNPVLQETFEIDGCYKYTANVSLIDPSKNYRYRRIIALANIVEKETGVQRNKTEYLQRQYSPLNLNFETDQNQKQYYKPGLPYNGKLQVSNPDETPASGEPIEICATVSRERIILDWFATKRVKFCRNYTSDSDGTVHYTIFPQSTDSVSIQLEAKSLKYARAAQTTRSGDDSLNQPVAGSTLTPFFSPSGSFIQLASVAEPMPCGSQMPIRLLFTSKENADYKFYYQVIRHGNIVQTGVQEVSFTTEDDVSKKFQDNSRLINESEIQIVPPPKSRSSNDSSSSSSSSEEAECPDAKEARYVPPIGEAKLFINVDASLSPSFNLLVFYVRDDKETVADSQKFEVQKCLKNKVQLEFGDEVKQPGTRTSLKITSSPNSLCGLKVVDKSVSLLDSNDQLTKAKIFQLIENMDTGIYYSTNPCYQDTPQPGLYTSLESSMIHPPQRPWSSSSYEDSYASFQDAGYLVISNLVLITRPCVKNQGYGGGPVYQAQSFSAESAYGSGGGVAMALASTARRPAAPPPQAVSADSANAKTGVNTKSAVDVRDYFPETWLFKLIMTDSDGIVNLKDTLPHTITEWDGSAVCINSEDGLGLSNTSSIKGFQAFFISYTLPVSVIRGEEFFLVVSIFNYVEDALAISVSLDNLDGFEVTSNSINGDVCVQPDTSTNLRIKLKGTKIGKNNITVRAETAQSNEICGTSRVSEAVARDAITKSLQVESEGFPDKSVKSTLFCPTDGDNQMFTETFDLSLPEDIVSDSARATVDVTGNVMGPAMDNLNNLVTLPTGCGEQNMVKFTPNYLVLDYLKDIGQLTDKITYAALRNLNAGYQKELTYRREDGSYSAFGEVDKEGSMFLTAFVLRSFNRAKSYITIDNSVLADMQNWIVARQQPDGCFPDVGRIIDSGLQGGLEKEKSSGVITAYVLASLLISNYENRSHVDAALSCLKEEETRLTPYANFLYAYAEALAGNSASAKKRIDDIKPLANTTDGVEYYNNPNGTKALNLETAAYAVLANLLVGNSASDVLPIIRYMTQNMNPQGGFFSTQDTCVGLEALSEFAKLVYKDPADILVTLNGGLMDKIEISEANKLLVQRKKIPLVPGKLQVEATGSGCGFVQTSLRFNTNKPASGKLFMLEIRGECLNSDCKKRNILTSVSYLPIGKKSGMSVVQIKMVSGMVPVKESLQNLVNDKGNDIQRFDVENNEVVIYLSEVSNAGVRFSFEVEEIVEVVTPQPGSAKIFDYYAPEKSATATYTFGEPDSKGEGQEP